MAKITGHRVSGALIVCGAAFALALVGAIVCGEKMTGAQDPSYARHLRLLIYAHFAIAQLAIVAAAFLLYRLHRLWRTHYIIISYNEHGMKLNPPGVHMVPGRVIRCHLGADPTALPLPPKGVPVLVYPMLMQSGRASGERMEAFLEAAFSRAPHRPRLFFQPVLGASPWLAHAAADHIRPLLHDDTGVLVVAHGSKSTDPPPEPALFCRRLRELLPTGTEICLAYFQIPRPSARNVLCGMHAQHILLLPFLLTEGFHFNRDLPKQKDAAACGKTLQLLPVAATLLRNDATLNTEET